ncbi:hypothetical protein JCM3766R1_003903 [Sporobolomyces carnicolor]
MSPSLAAPMPAGSLDEIPKISLRDFDGRREEIKAALVDAAENIGFFKLVDHGISKERIKQVFDQSQRFFDLDMATKQKNPWNGRNMGYENLAQIRPSTGYPDPKESLQLSFSRLPDDLAACWPTERDLAGFRIELETFMNEVQAVSKDVLRVLAEGVGLPTEELVEGTVCPDASDKSDSMSTLRLLKYHACEGIDQGPNYYRAGPHADFSVLTLLFQRPAPASEPQGGLEVCPGRTLSTSYGYGDRWVKAEIDDGEIVCNIGDQLMRWSDDRLKSTFHRVTCPRPGDYQGPRYSMGFFNQARRSAVIQGPKKVYPKITGQEFISQAMKRNYEAALTKSKLETFAISDEVQAENEKFQASGDGLARVELVA